ncbi:MAG TPA: threonine--tRNA ligase [Alphaproteobacteria bacterium]|nr:threonine--tRNA ligase [Alphaproteobacteria bacterium]
MNETAPADPQALHEMRHSCSHLMAAAIHQLWPSAKFGVGPAVENGFFYDVELPETLKLEDLEKIELTMRQIKNKKIPFERIEVPIDEAIRLMDKIGQTYKVELLNLLKEKGSTAVVKDTGDDDAVGVGEGKGGVATISLYKTGDFIDLCRGPHVRNTGETGQFKLTKLAGAYWRGDAKNPQLQRIYGICFPTKEELDHELWRIEEAKKRDHRKIGHELELFTFSADVGAGLPLWLPKGMAMRQELEFLAMQEERRDGYVRVATPQITREALYYRSRHLPYYKDDMYPPIDIDGENFYLRPMNCPHHHQVYLSAKRSYRELPLRVAEYGLCYRYEPSGGLSGLMRVRGFCMNDAHIYCRYDQAKNEFLNVMHLHARYYDLMGIEEYYMRLSLPDLNKLDKYVNEPAKWIAALEVIRAAMKESGYPFREAEGEAAFYGPKVDFMIKSAIGTEYAISTNQLDFLATETFDLKYVGEDGADHPVYVIHRAPLGSHERFIAFLIEHFAGAFPTWLAPVQVRVVPITDRTNDYAIKVRDRLYSTPVVNGTGGFRVDVDLANERMQKKIRNAQNEKIPYMLVVGDREAEQGTVAVRLRSGKDLGAMPLEQFIARVKQEAESRKDLPV